MAGDPYWDSVTFLAGFEGASSTDESPLAQTVTEYGTAAVSTSQAKYGTQSLALPASGDTGCSVPDNAAFFSGSDHFTIEGFVYFPTVPGSGSYNLLSKSNNPSQLGWDIYGNFGSDTLGFEAYDAADGSGDYTFMSGTFSPSGATWYHIAADFDGTTYRLYVDGVMIASTTYLIAIVNNTADFAVGYYTDSGGQSGQLHDAFVDEVRVTSGVARYASDGGFTPPTEAFPRTGEGGEVIVDDGTAEIIDTIYLDSGIRDGATGGLFLAWQPDTIGVAQTDATLKYAIGVLTQGIGVSPLPVGVHGVTAALSENIGVAQTLANYIGVRISDVTRISGSLGVALLAGVTAADRLGVTDLLRAGYTGSLTENVGVAETVSTTLGLVLVDRLGIDAALGVNALFSITQGQGIRISDTLAKFLSASVDETLGVEQTDNALTLAIASLAETVGVAEALTPVLMLNVIAADEVDISPLDAVRMLYAPTITEGFQITAGYLEPSGSFTAWNVNVRTGGATEYTNYEFNSFAQFGNKYVGASSTGIYELLGDDDSGADIISTIRGGYLQFGQTHLSRLKAAYIAVRGAGDYVLKIETGDGASYTYSVAARDMRNTKVHMGKGQRARYFTYELTSTGQDFDLDSLEFVPVVVERRV